MMIDRATMRRHVKKCGGYYNSTMNKWVLPGASNNCTPWSVETKWMSLERAYEMAEEHASECRKLHEFGDREHEYLSREYR